MKQESNHFASFSRAIIVFIASTLTPSLLVAQTTATKSEAETQELKIHKLVDLSGAKKLGLKTGPLEQIDLEMTKQVSNERIVGCSALIYKDGHEAYYGHWGQRDAKKKLPIERDTIFRIYSMSKPITSIAVMQLVERGKLELDKPVGQYLPDLKDSKVLVRSDRANENWKEVPAKREITVRDLLRHTSGMTYGFFGDTEVDKRYRKAGVLISDSTIEDTIEKLGDLPLRHHPGSRFLYSVSTDVLGRLIEVASGTTLDKYLAQNIFNPLDMNNTFFTVPTDQLGSFAQLYAPEGRKLKPARPLSSYRFVSQRNRFFSGGGGLCSTIDDYLKFSKMLLSNGTVNGQKIIQPETLKEMFTNQLDKIEFPPGNFKFGLGFSISRRGDYSWGGAAGTRFWVNPAENLAVLYMIQINPYGRRKHGEFVLDAAYKAIK